MVQILDEAETLGKFDIVLLTRERDTSNRSFLTYHEFIYRPTLNPPTIEDMMSQISATSGIEASHLTIAKYNPRMFEWDILTTSGEVTMTRKKEKTQVDAQKADPRMSPYFIKEGDVIGIRDNSKHPDLIAADDF